MGTNSIINNVYLLSGGEKLPSSTDVVIQSYEFESKTTTATWFLDRQLTVIKKKHNFIKNMNQKLVEVKIRQDLINLYINTIPE